MLSTTGAPRAFALALLLAAAAPAAADERGWDLLRQGGHVALIRHAEAPGTGDPPDFRLYDCSSQRNLGGAGRAQAVRLGHAFARRGVPVARVLSSRWRRCLETATLAFGRVEEFSPLDSLFGRAEFGPQQSIEVFALLAEAPRGGSIVLVTHQENIAWLTGGLRPASGEILIAPLRPDGLVEVTARIAPP